MHGLIRLRYPKLSRYPRLVHGVFARTGGVSRPPCDSLNTSYAVGDREADVDANLRKIRKALGADGLVFLNQVHGDKIVVFRKKGPPPPKRPPAADAMITDIPGLALMVNQADCQSVILFDPERRAVANIHCGWRGNVRDIIGKTVSRMAREFGSRPGRLAAAIGPSLGPCCGEFVSHREIFPADFREFMVGDNRFDLWAVSRRQLMARGVSADRIELAGICTRCRTDLFFSYRGEGRTGRFATAVMLV